MGDLICAKSSKFVHFAILGAALITTFATTTAVDPQAPDTPQSGVSGSTPRTGWSTADRINVLLAVIAGLAILANIGQAIILHRVTRRDVARDEVAGTLKAVQQTFVRTRLFDVAPDEELWIFGFVTLEELVGQLAAAHVAVSHSRDAPKPLRNAVEDALRAIKELYMFRDSFELATKGQFLSPTELRRKWKQCGNAEGHLGAIRPIVTRCREEISEFLGNR